MLCLATAWADPAAAPQAAQCQAGASAQVGLVVFGGWRAQGDWVLRWAQALREQLPGSAAQAGLCAVPGPADAAYVREDIDVGGLADAVLAAPASAAPVWVVAHSSGSFVAQHWLHEVALRPAALAYLARVRYFNLDGDAGSGAHALDAGLLRQLGAATAVYVRGGGGDVSANAGAMQALAQGSGGRVRLLALDGSASGCLPGARWCLHDVVVTRRPHDPAGFDLQRDYGSLDEAHPVQADYLR